MAVHVTLAPLSLADEKDFLAAVARSTRLHRPWVSPPSTPTRFRDRVQRMQGPVDHAFAVRRRDTNELVGVFEITNIVRGILQSGYLGYYAFAGHERQGLMQEGLRLLVRMAFKTMKLHRLEANIQPGNAASIGLVRSCGFVQEGYSPRYLKIRGRWRDHERWAIVA